MKQTLSIFSSLLITAALSGCIIAPAPPPRPVAIYRPPPPVYYRPPPPPVYYAPRPQPYYPRPGVTVGVHIN